MSNEFNTNDSNVPEAPALEEHLEKIRAAHSAGLSVLLVAVVECADGETAEGLRFIKMKGSHGDHFIKEATRLIVNYDPE